MRLELPIGKKKILLVIEKCSNSITFTFDFTEYEKDLQQRG